MADEIITKVAHAEFGDNRFRGYSISSLVGKGDFASLIALSISGKLLSENERALLNDLSIAITVGDPRIWPLKLIRVASAYGGELGAYASSLLSLDHSSIGHQISKKTAQFLIDFKNRFPNEDVDDETFEKECISIIDSGEKIPGVGVPFREVDERITAIFDRVKYHNRHDLPYWKLVLRLTSFVSKYKNIKPNIGLISSAICLDMGLDPSQVCLLLISLGQADFLANVEEGSKQASDQLKNLPINDIKYVGKELRKSPRSSDIK